jgi:hypothetical protein
MAQHDGAPPLSEMLHTIGGDGPKELLRDVVRDALQELIEEELTTTTGRPSISAPRPAPRSATAAATGWCRPRPGTWS